MAEDTRTHTDCERRVGETVTQTVKDRVCEILYDMNERTGVGSVCVCVRVRERDRERQRQKVAKGVKKLSRGRNDKYGLLEEPFYK